MNLGDISRLYQTPNGLNLPLVMEATRQVELKVINEQNRKERIDTRTYTLLSVLMCLIGLIFAFIASGYLKYPSLLGVTSVIQIIATMYLFEVLKPYPYAESGTFPSAWLCDDYIQGNESEEQNNNILGFALAYRLSSQEVTIKLGDDSNNKRLKLLNRALLIIQCSMIPMILSLVLEIL